MLSSHQRPLFKLSFIHSFLHSFLHSFIRSYTCIHWSIILSEGWRQLMTIPTCCVFRSFCPLPSVVSTFLSRPLLNIIHPLSSRFPWSWYYLPSQHNPCTFCRNSTRHMPEYCSLNRATSAISCLSVFISF